MSNKQRRGGGGGQKKQQPTDDVSAALVANEETKISTREVVTTHVASSATLTATAVAVKTEEQIQRAEAVLAISEPTFRSADISSPLRLSTPRLGSGPAPTPSSSGVIKTEHRTAVEASSAFTQKEEHTTSVVSSTAHHVALSSSSGQFISAVSSASHEEHALLRRKIVELEQICSEKDHENSELLFKLDDLISVLEAMSSAKVTDDANRAALEQHADDLTNEISALKIELATREESLLVVRKELAESLQRYTAEIESLKAAQTAADAASARHIEDLELASVQREQHFKTTLEAVGRANRDEIERTQREASASSARHERELEAARNEQKQQKQSQATTAAEHSTNSSQEHERGLKEQAELRMELEAQLLLARSELALHKEMRASVTTTSYAVERVTETANMHEIAVLQLEEDTSAQESNPIRGFVIFTATSFLISALVLQLATIGIFAVRFSHIGVDSFARRSAIALAGLAAALFAPQAPQRHDCAMLVAAAGLSFSISTVLLLSPPQSQISLFVAEVALSAACVAGAFHTMPRILVQPSSTLPLAWATAFVVELTTVSAAASIFVLPEIALQRGLEALLIVTEIAGLVGVLAAVVIFLEKTIVDRHHDARQEDAALFSTGAVSSMHTAFKRNPWLILSSSTVLAVALIQLDSLPTAVSLDLPTVFFACAVTMPLHMIFFSEHRQFDSIISIVCSILLLGVAKCFHATESTWHVGGTVGFVLGLLIGLLLIKGGSRNQSACKLTVSLSLLLGAASIAITSGQLFSQAFFVAILSAVAAVFCLLHALIARSTETAHADPSEGRYVAVD